MGSKKTSGIVICLLSENVQVKWPHCIHLADENGVKKNERKCYLLALRIWKSQNDARASPRRYKTVQNGFQKNERFQKIKFPHHTCFHFLKNMKKSAYARFFRSIYSFFCTFLKCPKSEKIGKMAEKSCFFKFFLMLCSTFSHISALHNMLIFLHFMLQNKNTQKTKKYFLKLFF